MEYDFSEKPCQYTTAAEMTGWTVIFLPKNLSKEIRDSFKHLEEGWGRMRVIAMVGDSEWQTAIWFDTKHNTYMLPLNAKIRKQEKITLNDTIRITIWI